MTDTDVRLWHPWLRIDRVDGLNDARIDAQVVPTPRNA